MVSNLNTIPYKIKIYLSICMSDFILLTKTA